jgi:hypothetical protein
VSVYWWGNGTMGEESLPAASRNLEGGDQTERLASGHSRGGSTVVRHAEGGGEGAHRSVGGALGVDAEEDGVVEVLRIGGVHGRHQLARPALRRVAVQHHQAAGVLLQQRLQLLQRLYLQSVQWRGCETRRRADEDGGV